ncbi:hypothetical protein HYH03_004191 [Edaphochlamys debaryana]|uniref:Uncharacterized protein n=1 Tax=Edaphochlamys debaryana TaxID=47281 RepID=A0A835YHV3_9CHLO|nr:hypothetical protein HYH03_004191 [Edaphochlamys debaryana]|eukprot:KAG2497929.1 hypothetical protein HYH03_004191 [Edaphochlamys debaryana]
MARHRQPFKLPDLCTLADELVRGDGPQPVQRVLSAVDQAAATAPPFGVRMLFAQSIVAPLLKQALGTTLTSIPQFAGRLKENTDRRTYDVACTDEGARLVIGSTSAGLQQLREALDEDGGPGLVDPWARYALPLDLAVVARKSLPLLSVFLLHLSGGGAVLSITCLHALADFETLQTFASHFSAAYNALLCSAFPEAYASAENGARAPDSTGKAEAAPANGAPTTRVSADGRAVITPGRVLLRTQPPPDRRSPVFDPARVEALAREELPPGVTRVDGLVVLSTWGWACIILRAIYEIFLRGGGLEARAFYLSPNVLAALKRRANAELVEERAREGPGGVLAGVEWVSSNDALVARLMQLQHAAPIRRPHPTTLLRVADMRPRMEPPLPSGLMGNVTALAVLEGVRPAELSLGRLAGLLRRDLQENVCPQFAQAVWDNQQWATKGSGGPRSSLLETVVHPEPHRNLLAAEGPTLVTSQSAQPQLWQFGPDLPLSLLPLGEVIPNTHVLFTCAKGGMALRMTLHRCVWKQLDDLFPPSQGGLVAMMA